MEPVPSHGSTRILRYMIVSTALSIAIPRKVFFEYWLDAEHGRDLSSLQRHIITSKDIDESRVVNLSALREDISRYAAEVRRRYLKLGYGPDRFQESYAEWLDEADFGFSIILETPRRATEAGRPRKAFKDLGPKSRNAFVAPLLGQPAEELMHAANLKLYVSGERARSLMSKEGTHT